MKKIFIGALIFLLTASIFSIASAKKIEGIWRLDGSASAEPKNFRFMTDDWHVNSHGKEPTRQGLEELRASASGQPSESSLTAIKKKILEIAPDADIFIIDLRQESHGFVNSLPVSWYVKNNLGNVGKTLREVERDELDRLENLRGIETTFEPLGDEDKNNLKPVTIVPRFMATERTLCEKLKINYKRYASADMQFPAPEIVDDFIIFVANLLENSWLHFHCQAGHGRTTTFLVMYDILKNPDLSLQEICRRHYLLGGTNLLLEIAGDKQSLERAQKIRLFYEWVQSTNSERTGLQWSEWLETQLVMQKMM